MEKGEEDEEGHGDSKEPGVAGGVPPDEKPEGGGDTKGEDDGGEEHWTLVDELADFFDLLAGEFLIGGVEEGGDEVLRFSLEEGVEETFEGGSLGFALVDHGCIEVASPFFGMFYHFLIFEGGEEGADGGVGWGIGKFLEDILCGGLAKTVEDVHDLALAP